jgi:hypothetical protein
LVRCHRRSDGARCAEAGASMDGSEAGPGSVELIPSVGEADRVRGAVDAPVTLVGFGDYDCPYIVRAHAVIGG